MTTNLLMLIARKNLLALIALVIFSAGCASAPKEKVAPAPAVESAASQNQDRVDLEGLARSLNLTRPVEVLGYQETGFNSCSVGYGFSYSKDCRRLTLSVIHVRLQCRDSEGTISSALSASDLRAISGQGVRWTLAGVDGVAQSDGDGYAEIRAVFPKSPRAQRLRLAVGLQFLYVRANEVTRVVTPRPWCHESDDHGN